MRVKPILKKLPHVLAIILGLAAALIAWSQVNRQVTEARQTVTVVALNKDLDAYTAIKIEDLTPVSLPTAAVDNYAATKPEEVAGKIALAPLFKGKPVDKRSLADPGSSAGNYQVIGINVDPARAAGVRAGDIVDVYWLLPERGGWTPENATYKVAGGVRVLKVCDEKGIPLEEPGGPVQQTFVGTVTPKKSASIVYLAVRPEDVPRVIGGSAPKSASIALAKRTNETKNEPLGGDAGANKQPDKEVSKAGTGAGTPPAAPTKR